MRALWILTAVYFVLGALFLLFNPEWAITPMRVNLFIVKTQVYLILTLFLISFAFMVLISVIASALLGEYSKENQRLRAQLYEKSIAEIQKLQDSIEVRLAEMEDRMERMLKGEQSNQANNG